MAGTRDKVRFEANERVDLPDFKAVQDNARSDVRAALRYLLFGATANGERALLLGGWQVEATSPESAQVDVHPGAAVLIEKLEDGSLEYGVIAGWETATAQQADLTGLPAGTVGIYVRFHHAAGVSGNRLFWNSDTAQEEVQAIDTRYVANWSVQAAAASPGSEWVQIAEVAWSGGTVAAGDITHKRNLFFEGDEGAATPFENAWGDGADDRSDDRGQHGVKDLHTWVQAVRRQLQDIIGEGGWYKAVPVDLATARAHVDTTSDAHGASPSWSGTVSATNFEGSVNGTQNMRGLLTTQRGVDGANELKVGGLHTSASVDGTPHDGSSADEAAQAFAIFKANELKTGTLLRWRLMVEITRPAGADVLEIIMRLHDGDAITIATAQSNNAASNDVLIMEGSLNIREAGANGTWVSGYYTVSEGNGVKTGSKDDGGANYLDTTTLVTLQVVFKWTTGVGASNVATLRQFDVWLDN